MRRFHTPEKIREEIPEKIREEIAKMFFNGETHANVTKPEKNITSFDDNTEYLRYELSVGYERPVYRV